MSENKILVVAAVVDTKELLLYKPDGSTFRLEQGDPRVRRILDDITPKLTANPGVPVEVSLELEVTNEFVAFEEKTNGAVKLFRVAKSKLARFFGITEKVEQLQRAEVALTKTILGAVPTEAAIEQHEKATTEHAAAVEGLAEVLKVAADSKKEVTPAPQLTTQVPPAAPVSGQRDPDMDGTLPTPGVRVIPLDTRPKTPPKPDAAAVMKSAVDDILKHAVPVTSEKFKDHHVSDNQDKHALVAVVDGKGFIPDAQHLHTQMVSVNQGEQKPDGMVEFMRRAGAVKRTHSVADLMKFMKRGDLPVANDGSIIIYKILTNRFIDGKQVWVDCHSEKVVQGIGDYVCMAEHLVDHNRRNECSNGLHVARRQYLSGFSGDIMVMAKVAPEDVIAVPEYDANKMRVCGYHILFQICEADRQKLKANRPIEPTDATAVLLARAIAGDHPGKLRRVEITGNKGTGVKTTVLSPMEDKAGVGVTEALKPVGALADNDQIGMEGRREAPIAPAAVEKKVIEAVKPKVEVAMAAPVTRAEQALAMLAVVKEATTELERKPAAEKLLAFKKTSKVSWLALGLTEKDVALVLKTAGQAPVAKPKQAPKKKGPTPKILQASNGVKNPASKAPKAPAGTSAPIPQDDPTAGPSARIAAQLPHALKGDKEAAQLVLSIKKQAKKAWDKLGVTDVQVKLVTTVANK